MLTLRVTMFKTISKKLTSFALCGLIAASTIAVAPASNVAAAPSGDAVGAGESPVVVNTYHIYKFDGQNPDTDTSERWANSPYRGTGENGNGYKPAWSYAQSTGMSGPFEPVVFRRSGSTDPVYCLDYGKVEPSGELQEDTSETAIKEEIKRVFNAGFGVKTGEDYGVSDAELEWSTAIAIKIVDGGVYDHETGEALNPDLGVKEELFNVNDPDSELIPTDTQERAARSADLIRRLVAAKDTPIEYNEISSGASGVKKKNNNENFSFGPYTATATKGKVLLKLSGVPSDANVKIVNEADEEITEPVDSGTKYYIKGSSPKTIRFKLIAAGTVKNPVFTRLYNSTPNEQDVAQVSYTEPKDSFDLVVYKPVKIKKIDKETGEAMKDISFTVNVVQDQNETLFTSATTDANGIAEFSQLEPGDYVLNEATSGRNTNGYLILQDQESFAFSVAEDGSISGALARQRTTEDGAFIIENTPVTVVITKYDSKTNAPVPGAEIKLWNLLPGSSSPGQYSKTAVTNDEGKAIFKYVPTTCGLQYKETKAPSGYKLDTLTRNFTLEVDGRVSGTTNYMSLDFKNEPVKVKITKLNANTDLPVAGASYEVKGTNGNNFVSTYTTDENGSFEIEYLAPGVYTYKETESPTGYLLNPDEYTFTVTEDGNIEGQTTVKDSPVSVDVVINKVEKLTKEPVDGAEFEIYEWDAENREYSENGISPSVVLATNRFRFNGLTYTEKNLGRFLIKETVVPNGYVQRAFQKEIDITSDEVQAASPFEVTAENTKTRADIAVVVNWIDHNNVYNTRPENVAVDWTIENQNIHADVPANRATDENYNWFKGNINYTSEFNPTATWPGELDAQGTTDKYILTESNLETSGEHSVLHLTYKIEGTVDLKYIFRFIDHNNVDGYRPRYFYHAVYRATDVYGTGKEEITEVNGEAVNKRVYLTEAVLPNEDNPDFRLRPSDCDIYISRAITGLPKYNDQGIKYCYSIEQEKLSFYTLRYYYTSAAMPSPNSFWADGTGTYYMTNIHDPEPAPFDQYLNLTFTNKWTGSDDDFDRVALDKNTSFNFNFYLQDCYSDAKYYGVLDTNGKLVFSRIPVVNGKAKLKVINTTNQYFDFSEYETDSGRIGDTAISVENGSDYVIELVRYNKYSKEFNGYYITDTDIVEWRGYSDHDSKNDNRMFVTPLADFEYTETQDTVVITKYIGQNSTIVIPPTYKVGGTTKNVVIAKNSTSQDVFTASNLQYVTFLDGVTVENDDASYLFENSNVVGVYNIPDSIKNASSMFKNATNLKEIGNIPKNIENLNFAFSGCSNLEYVPNLIGLENLHTAQYMFYDSGIKRAPVMFNCGHGAVRIDYMFSLAKNIRGNIYIFNFAQYSDLLATLFTGGSEDVPLLPVTIYTDLEDTLASHNATVFTVPNTFF